jgi:hypothetical protein
MATAQPSPDISSQSAIFGRKLQIQRDSPRCPMGHPAILHQRMNKTEPGLALERHLFLRLAVSDSAHARMRSYEAKKMTAPSRGFEVEESAEKKFGHG